MKIMGEEKCKEGGGGREAITYIRLSTYNLNTKNTYKFMHSKESEFFCLLVFISLQSLPSNYNKFFFVFAPSLFSRLLL
jgi:hypothetical protein